MSSYIKHYIITICYILHYIIYYYTDMFVCFHHQIKRVYIYRALEYEEYALDILEDYPDDIDPVQV